MQDDCNYIFSEDIPSSLPAFCYSSAKSPRLSADPPSTHMAALSLADHLDMARPAHEDPGGFRRLAIAPTADGGVAITIPSPAAGGKRRLNAAAAAMVGRAGHQGEQVSLLSRSLPSQPVTIAPAAAVSISFKKALKKQPF